MSSVTPSPYGASQRAAMARVERWGPLRLLRFSRLYILRRFRELVAECRAKPQMILPMGETVHVLGVGLGMSDATERPQLCKLLAGLAETWFSTLLDCLVLDRQFPDRGERAWLAWAIGQSGPSPLERLLGSLVRLMDDERTVRQAPSETPAVREADPGPEPVPDDPDRQAEIARQHREQCWRRRGRRSLMRSLGDWIVDCLHRRAFFEEYRQPEANRPATNAPPEPHGADPADVDAGDLDVFPQNAFA